MKPETEAMVLRRLGETADGWRDFELSLVLTGTGAKQRLEIVKRDEFESDNKKKFKLVKHIAKASTAGPLVAFDKVAFVAGDHQIACVAPPTDCVFWTDSAIEKFLYPYYEQVRIFPEDYLRSLKTTIRDPLKRKLIVAIRHDSPS